MVMHFNYTFRYYLTEVTISKSVTDRMEERDSWKKVCASEWMTQTLREHTGDKYFGCVHANRIERVAKKDTVPLKDTFEAMAEAKEAFRKEQ